MYNKSSICRKYKIILIIFCKTSNLEYIFKYKQEKRHAGSYYINNDY